MHCRPLLLCAYGIIALGARFAAGANPNDPDLPLQWGLCNTGQAVDGQPGTVGADVRALEAWSIHAGTSSIVVAIVGRGIDPHPEFADRLLEGCATVGDPFDTLDACPHDTHLAGEVDDRDERVAVRELPDRELASGG